MRSGELVRGSPPSFAVNRRVARRRRLQRQIRAWSRRSLIPIPCAYLALAVWLGVAAPTIDRDINIELGAGIGIQAARDVLSSTATGMIAFTGFVVTSVLVTVQFAAGKYSPRLVLWFRRDRLVKNAIGSFLAAPVFALVALRELELERVNYRQDVTVVVALILLGGAGVLFLALLERAIDGLRPRWLYAGVAREGVHAVRTVYPIELQDLDAASGPARAARAASGSARADRAERGTSDVLMRGRAGVIGVFDRELLVAAARQSNTEIQIVAGAGEFVTQGQVLMRVHGRGALDEEILRSAVSVGDERTIEQDPAFAIRIIVDTAISALSPAVNDPTTATNALDVLELIVRELAGRALDATFVADADGTVRLRWWAPDWPDLVDLAFEEIRAYSGGSVQVCRRLRAALEDLRRTAPPQRRAVLDEHLGRLETAVELHFAERSPDRQLARETDRMGLGSTRR